MGLQPLCQPHVWHSWSRLSWLLFDGQWNQLSLCSCTHSWQNTCVNSFVLSGSWDIKGGSCETDPAGNWRAGGSAVVDTLRHGKLPFTKERVFRANYHTLHVCEWLREAWHRTALHRHSSYVLCPSCACCCPWWSTDPGSTRQYPESFSAFFICFYDPYDFLCSFSHAWDKPSFLLLTISFLFLGVCF